MLCIDCKCRDYIMAHGIGVLCICDEIENTEESILKVMEVFNGNECDSYRYDNE